MQTTEYRVADYINCTLHIYEVKYYFKLTQTTMHAVYECSLDLELNMTTYITFHISVIKEMCVFKLNYVNMSACSLGCS